MLCLTCTMTASIDFEHYGISRAKDWLSVDCGKKTNSKHLLYAHLFYIKEKSILEAPFIITIFSIVSKKGKMAVEPFFYILCKNNKIEKKHDNDK